MKRTCSSLACGNLDVTSTPPNQDLLVGCCVRWQTPMSSQRGKLSESCILEILREESHGKRSVDVEAWIIPLIFQEVCRKPMHHSPDLQQLLCLDLHQSFLSGLFFSAVLVCMKNCASFLEVSFLPFLRSCYWTHELVCKVVIAQSANTVHSEIVTPRPFRWWKIFNEPLADAFPWSKDLGPVPHALLRSMLVAYFQLPDSNMLCRSALTSLAALGTRYLTIATQAPSLLLVLPRRSSSSSICVDAFHVEGIGKWQLCDSPAHGPDSSNQHFLGLSCLGHDYVH